MDALKPYHVTIAGVRHTLLLDGQDASRYGDRAVPVAATVEVPAKEASRPANKSRRAPKNK